MLVDRLRGETTVVTAELRPPRAELDALEGMDAWIDTYHAIRRMSRQDVSVFLTDSAVGTQEENNLRHLIANLGRELPHEMVVPFLTSKHSLEFCLSYATQARQHGFDSLVVLGGDKTVGRPRCVEHAWDLRQHIRRQEPDLILGGWANPHAAVAQQADFLLDERFCAEFYLTQVVSHLNLDPVKRFLEETQRRSVSLPGMFCVFYYRSANPKTLQILGTFMPVPVQGLIEEFATGATAIDVCARTIRELLSLGVRHICVCNLPMHDASRILLAIMEKVRR
jgi:hypothetical protein